MKGQIFICIFLLGFLPSIYSQESFSYVVGTNQRDFGWSVFESENYYYSVNLRNSDNYYHGTSVLRFSNGEDLIEREIVKQDTLCRLFFGAALDNGNILCAGRIEVENMQYLYTCVMTEDLIILDEKYFDLLPEGFDWFDLYDISKAENGDFVLVGHMDNHLPSTLNGLLILRLDQEGNLIDYDTYVSSLYDSSYGSDLLRKADGSGYFYFGGGSYDVLEFNNALTLVDSSNWLGSYPYFLTSPVTAIYLPDGNFAFVDRMNDINYYNDIRFMIFTPEFEQVMDTTIIKEGRQCPAIFKGMDYTNPNQIWVLLHNDMPTFTGDEDYEILLLDSQLNITHSKLFTGSSDYGFPYLLSTKDGGCLLTGSIRQEYGSNLTDIFILKVMPEDITTGDRELSLPNIKQIGVYPNPFKENIFTEAYTEGLKFNLINLCGEEILHKQIPAHMQESINTTGILPGVYIYSLTDDMGNVIQSGKLIK